MSAPGRKKLFRPRAEFRRVKRRRVREGQRRGYAAADGRSEALTGTFVTLGVLEFLKGHVCEQAEDGDRRAAGTGEGGVSARALVLRPPARRLLPGCAAGKGQHRPRGRYRCGGHGGRACAGRRACRGESSAAQRSGRVGVRGRRAGSGCRAPPFGRERRGREGKPVYTHHSTGMLLP